jgi:hypothetical protein
LCQASENAIAIVDNFPANPNKFFSRVKMLRFSLELPHTFAPTKKGYNYPKSVKRKNH